MSNRLDLAAELTQHGYPQTVPRLRRRLRVLTFTRLFPNSVEPLHGIFVGQRISALSRFCELQVVAPVPWTPQTRAFGDRYFRYSQIRREEHQRYFTVQHPRFFVLPQILKSTDGLLMAISCLVALKAIRKSFPFDVIDAHWAYPDGVCAAILANFFRVPLALTVRGDDINILPKYFGRRHAIRWALRSASLVIALSNELDEKTQSLAGIPIRTVVIPNGIDPETFYPGDRCKARHRLGIPLTDRVLLSVGRLHASKGYPLLVKAVAQLKTKHPAFRLVIVGGSDHEADSRPMIEGTARRLGISEKVQLLGAQPQSVLADWYRAADLFCLPTLREGSANVLVEALACGLPCITTPVGGNPDLISSPDLGILAAGDSGAFAAAISDGLARTWDRGSIARCVQQRTWASVARECYVQLEDIVNKSAGFNA